MGVILYQEQAMQISKELAGFSGAKADDLRKAIGKKNRAAMAALKPEFVAGARASGTSNEVIEFLWQTNEKSADYSFNKSHAACYGLISYRTAWLKANYPAEYMAALISSVMSTKDKVPFFVARCEEMGIEILPPDVNLSDHEFTVVERNIRFGLDAVKGVGYQAVEAIKRAREEGGEFRSLWDFCERVDSRAVNRKAIDALIKCGAFGSTGRQPQGHAGSARAGPGRGTEGSAGRAHRPGLDLRPGARGAGGRAPAGAARRRRGAAFARRPPADPHRGVRAGRAAGDREGGDRPVHLRASAEASARGAAARTDCPLGALPDRKDKDWVTVGGIIVEAKRIRTRNGDPMMFLTLDDLGGSVEVLLFGKALAEHEAALAVDTVVLVRGRVDHKEAGKTCLVAQSVEVSPRPRRRSSGPRGGRGRGGPRGDHAGPAAASARRSRQPLGERDRRSKQTIEGFPGPAEVLLDIDTRPRPAAPASRRRVPRPAHPDTPRRAPARPRSVRCRRAGGGLAAGGDSSLAQAHRQLDFITRPGPSRFSPGCLKHAWQLLKARRGEEGHRSPLAELALADVRVPVAI